VTELRDEPWIVGKGLRDDPQFGAWPTLDHPRIAYAEVVRGGIDHAEAAKCAQVRADRFGDAGGQPRGVGVVRYVCEFQNSDCVCVGGDGRGSLRRSDCLDRRDEPVAASRNGFDERRRARIISKRLPQLGHRLGQRVVGDVRVRPERLEKRFLGDERSCVVEEIEEQVQQLRRYGDGFTVARQAKGRAIDGELAKPIRRSQRRYFTGGESMPKADCL